MVSATRIIIAETKGQEDLDVPLKMERLRQWCEDINRVHSNVTYDFVYVDEAAIDRFVANYRGYPDPYGFHHDAPC